MAKNRTFLLCVDRGKWHGRPAREKRRQRIRRHGQDAHATASKGSVVEAELAPDFFVRNAFSASERSTGAPDRRGRFRRDFLFFLGNGGYGTCQGINYGFEKADNGRELPGRKLINQFAGLLSLRVRRHRYAHHTTGGPGKVSQKECRKARPLPSEASQRDLARVGVGESSGAGENSGFW
jgi:hypothetical protein